MKRFTRVEKTGSLVRSGNKVLDLCRLSYVSQPHSYKPKYGSRVYLFYVIVDGTKIVWEDSSSLSGACESLRDLWISHMKW